MRETRKNGSFRRLFLLLLFTLLLAESARANEASVVLGRVELFKIHASILGYPPEVRAKDISRRLLEVAKDDSIPPESVVTLEGQSYTQIVAGDRLLFSIQDADALPSGKARTELARDYAEDIRKAIIQYRIDFAREQIVVGILLSVLTVAGMFVILMLLQRIHNRFLNSVKTNAATKYGKLLEDSRAKRILDSLIVVINLIRFVVFAVILLAGLEIVLHSLPWTHHMSGKTLNVVLGPVRTMGEELAGQGSNLLFLAVLVILVYYILKIIHVLFNLLEIGRLSIPGFEPEWSRPTYNIVRLIVIALAIVVAFPYVPGSNSLAFKGVSVFIGVLFSLGSSSTVASVIAGLSLTYRRAFRVGDLVRIGDVTGVVKAMRLTVTQLCTPKNEIVTIPNSEILTSTATNYSTLAAQDGLILHTSVTIGYDTPWRQVEALLLMAASRTSGILKTPEPFVQQKELQDFYVEYELNAYTTDAAGMFGTYSRLHQNIQDAFNEYGVQIMSPNYEDDPDRPKIVPKARWFEAPARKDES